MEDAAFYISLIANFIYAGAMLTALLPRVRAGEISEASAKAIYGYAVTVVGLLCGAAAFPALVYLFRWADMPQSLGHGEVVVAALTLNFLLGVLMAGVGRIVLGWKPLQ
ncbi:MAG: hypothetical protein ACOY33_11725 [Pseudomonadota bacterium]